MWTNRKTVIVVISIIAMAMFLACGDDSPTNSIDPPPDQSSLLLTRLCISTVPGGSDEIIIRGIDSDGLSDTYTVSNSNPGVVSAILNDTTITVTGIDYGTSDITVTSGSGLSSTTVVQVYSPFELDTGELLIAFVDVFTLRYNDIGSGGGNDGAFYHPVTTDGFRALGALGVDDYNDPDGVYAMVVVKAKPGSDALAEPLGYEWIYSDVNTGADMFGSFWAPIPPEGYVALGTVVSNNTWDEPSLSDVVCVREDLTVPTQVDSTNRIYNNWGTGGLYHVSCFPIAQPNAGPHDYAYLTTGTFVAVEGWYAPVDNPLLNVLNVELPLLAEAPYQSYVPTLNGHGSPPEETILMMGKAMLVPHTAVSDVIYGENPHWRVANSPMYRLERQIYYKMQYYNYNQTSEIQTNSVTITSGVTTSESQSFWSETSVSLSVEAGVSIKAFEAKTIATVSTSFGYETQTSVSQLTERSVESSINTPPGKSAALWQEFNRYVLKRHNGTDFEVVASWEFGIDSYVTDEYPDE
ncbi:MAG: Vps62-related protein [candidate division Zixibacteria bacterium]